MKEVIGLLRGFIFRLSCICFRRNVSIGPGLKVYCKLEIRGPGTVSIGESCTVSRVVGDSRHYVTIYTHSPTAMVSIGNNVHLVGARISAKWDISIGNDCIIEEAGLMDTDFHSLSPDRGPPNENSENSCVELGHRVSVGARSVICKGVVIGNDAIIYPGSIVTRRVPAGSTVCGNPARLVKHTSELIEQ